MNLDILYVAWNRLEFTEFSWRCSGEHRLGSRLELIVYDDGSEDGTEEFLSNMAIKAPVECEFWQIERRSPPAVMNRYVARSEADGSRRSTTTSSFPPAGSTG